MTARLALVHGMTGTGWGSTPPPVMLDPELRNVMARQETECALGRKLSDFEWAENCKLNDPNEDRTRLREMKEGKSVGLTEAFAKAAGVSSEDFLKKVEKHEAIHGSRTAN